MINNLTKRIQHQVIQLPEPLMLEVLDFIGYLGHRHGLWTDFGEEGLVDAQEDALRHVWDNAEDEIWNDVQTL